MSKPNSKTRTSPKSQPKSQKRDASGRFSSAKTTKPKSSRPKADHKRTEPTTPKPESVIIASWSKFCPNDILRSIAIPKPVATSTAPHQTTKKHILIANGERYFSEESVDFMLDRVFDSIKQADASPRPAPKSTPTPTPEQPPAPTPATNPTPAPTQKTAQERTEHTLQTAQKLATGTAKFLMASLLLIIVGLVGCGFYTFISFLWNLCSK